jgi:hypothetical protein
LRLVHRAQICEGKAGILKRLEVGRFMTESQFLDDLEIGRSPIRGATQTVRDTEIEGSEMAAGEMIAEVGGGQPYLVGL